MELSPAHFRRLPEESEKERLERLLSFAEKNAAGEHGGFWALERDRLKAELDELK